MNARIVWAIVAGVLCTACGSESRNPPAPDTHSDPGQDTGWTDDLPEGDQGITANYPGDVGIDSGPHVIFADDFESYGNANELWNRWDNVFHTDPICFFFSHRLSRWIASK